MRANDTTPTLNVGGRSSRNSVAASIAAEILDGDTSVACIDADVSMATITVARSRGTFTAISGRAMASDSATNASRIATAGR